MAHFDQTAAVAIKGYTWLPDLRRPALGQPVRMRMLGQRAIGIAGPNAVRFFYADGHLERHTALPGPMVDTLFGQGAVHTLDGQAHRVRKALFVELLLNGGAEGLAKLAGEAFDEAAERWRGGAAISLLDESARVLATAVTNWTGVPEEGRDRDAWPPISSRRSMVRRRSARGMRGRGRRGGAGSGG